MSAWDWALQSLLLVPVVVGSIYGLLRLAAVLVFTQRRRRSSPPGRRPGVSVLKPVCGLDKGLEENLRSVCVQNYPEFEVVFAVQTPDDPALPTLRKLAAEFGPERVKLVVARTEPRANGKIFNLCNAAKASRHEVLIVSDSDIRVRPDYLEAIVAPLADERIGYSCTIYRGVQADRWFEKLEQLSLHDFITDIVFASLTGASDFCMGSSVALRRSTLEAIGGFEPLSDYLVEDFEMGRRIQALGLGLTLVPYSVDAVVDLVSAPQWWNHQLYWDQNTWMARPIGFFCHVLIRSLPFALLFAAARLFDPLGLSVLAGVLVLRLLTTAATLTLLDEREDLRSLAWLPLRDVAGLPIWLLALRKRSVVWRGIRFELTPDGRMLPPAGLGGPQVAELTQQESAELTGPV